MMTNLTTWVDHHVSRAPRFVDIRKLLGFGAGAAGPSGLFCEFGVAKGDSLKFLAKSRPEVTWHGFDTFTGLPESGSPTRWLKGSFDCGGKIPELGVDNVEYHVGLFDHTLLPFLKNFTGPISFLHIDSDLYKSASTILNWCSPRIVPGTIIAFDEFWGFKGWDEPGMSEAQAFYEWCIYGGPSTYTGQFPPREVECLGIQEKYEKALFRVTR